MGGTAASRELVKFADAAAVGGNPARLVRLAEAKGIPVRFCPG